MRFGSADSSPHRSPYAPLPDEDFPQADLIFQELDRTEAPGEVPASRSGWWISDWPQRSVLRGTRFEVAIRAPFLRTGGFDAQGIITVRRLIRHLGMLRPEQGLWLGMSVDPNMATIRTNYAASLRAAGRAAEALETRSVSTAAKPR